MGMPKYAAKTDGNHVEVMRAFGQLGYSVQDTSKVGGGFPDLIVGRHGMTWLVEIKADKGKLRPAQIEFFAEWRGTPPILIRSVDDVVNFSERQKYKSEKA